ncbi:MAG: LON peptidase substrate-binding domain-containing protein [Flavobacteriaceae bacterium]
MQLPMFPLQSIFFPGETVPLHIFEERYKQLIRDCRTDALTFGIPVYIYDSIHYGTEVQLVEIVNTYENGEMDVTCVARQVFRLKTFRTQLEGKLYSGGDVEFLDNVNDADLESKSRVLQKLQQLYSLMDMPYSPISVEKFSSYMLVHKMGLSFEQEYELLQMAKESDRLDYILEHLKTTIAVLQEVNRTKLTIKLNGDFKNFDPLDFDEFTM